MNSWVQRTAWPQQLPEGVLIPLWDDATEMEPSPPLPSLVLPMELDPPTPQQFPPSTSCSWQQEVDVYPSGHFLGDVSTRAQVRWWSTARSLRSPAATASGPAKRPHSCLPSRLHSLHDNGPPLSGGGMFWCNHK
ncbi:uncharacterized protein LOC124622541 [Schistocerca americana]|uniref:uncharacterized protein LOC124622541 n=1 Tax=Schistocerca americana TaxID=7009 RepID=UPI001F500F98|nr:uncharacterized protein LOC124622541 [Schistocerca americana]